MSKANRKKMPSINEICEWYINNPPEWFFKLWRGLDGFLMAKCKEILTTKCWLTKKKGDNIVRCHIVPDALGGSNHPSNFVLLKQDIHARCPNVSDANVFIDWLITEAKQKSEKATFAYQLVFPNIKIKQIQCLASVIFWTDDHQLSLRKILDIQSIIPFPDENYNPYVEDAFIIKKFIDKYELNKYNYKELEIKLDEIHKEYKNKIPANNTKVQV